MIKNLSGQSPFRVPFAFGSSVDVFINGNNGGNVKVLSSTGEELARHEFSGKIIRDLKVSQNQSLECEVNGGGDVIFSILEENASLKGGTAVGRFEIVANGEDLSFPLAYTLVSKAECMCFINGSLFSDFEIEENSIVFNEPVFKGAKIELQLIKPQE
ncbi:hypothetical protein [Helicobacter sp. WB40]|uniref:hypothetical protein n=1 Tax=Helicobacter sp. WB40 TaxID=3004130 RepID=UPI0022EBBABC|nr:hypothetical protein [Helicobacter sp. WB40]MDA3966630.1 hypothetical protein [Helicobacter sp. WB40]